MGAAAEDRTSDESHIEDKAYVSPAEERVIVRAARLRLSTDKKLGIQSPWWVREIAKRPI